MIDDPVSQGSLLENRRREGGEWESSQNTERLRLSERRLSIFRAQPLKRSVLATPTAGPLIVLCSLHEISIVESVRNRGNGRPTEVQHSTSHDWSSEGLKRGVRVYRLVSLGLVDLTVKEALGNVRCRGAMLDGQHSFGVRCRFALSAMVDNG